MVISVKEVLWSQTVEEVQVRIIFSSAISARIDVFTHSDFIKVNSPPIFREIFLAHSIDESQSKYRILESEVKFYLKKSNPCLWDHFKKIVTKGDKIQLKEKIIEDNHVKCEQESKEKMEEKTIKKRKDVEKEISRETEMRKEIDKIHNSICKEQIPRITQVKTVQTPGKVVKKPVKIVPEIRQKGEIIVEFTERRFLTPKRESQDILEQEWIQKQYEARKVIGFVEEDLRPEERNLEWLQEKGRTFFNSRNYLGAIAVYSNAIKLTPKCYDLYLHRSACHWKLRNLQRCIEDCSSAFELLTPAVRSNLAARIQCLARRGAALCKLGLLEQGLGELKAAFALDPKDENLARDIAMIEEKLLTNDDDSSEE